MQGDSDFYFIPPVHKTQICSCLLYHNHLARCLDLNWWIVALGWSMMHLLTFRIILTTAFLQVTVQWRRWYSHPPPPHPPLLPPSLCWQWARPSTHSPSMQSGRPSESSSRHRWGKYNSGIGSPKVASGPLLSEVFGLLASPCKRRYVILFFFRAGGKKIVEQLYIFLPTLKPLHQPCCRFLRKHLSYRLPAPLAKPNPDCLCVCISFTVAVFLSRSLPVCVCLRGCFIRAVVVRWLRGPLIKGGLLGANKGPARAADVSRLC